MKKIWLLGSASLLICAGVAVCNVQASSVTTSVPSSQASCSESNVLTCATSKPMQSIQANENVAAALSLPAGSNQLSKDVFNIPSSTSMAHVFETSFLHDGSISAKSLVLLLSAVAAFCLLRRRDSIQDEQMTQHQNRPATLWSRHWTTQPSQDSV